MTSTNSSTATLPFLQNILDLYFKHFKLPEDVVNRILQVVLDLQHFKSSLFIFAATILQSSSAIHHISNIDNYVHQIIKFQSILITSRVWKSVRYGARIRRIFLDGYGVLVVRIINVRIVPSYLNSMTLSSYNHFGCSWCGVPITTPTYRIMDLISNGDKRFASILEGFTDEPPLEENDDLFDLESKENEWKKILYDAPIDDLMTEDKVFDLGTLEKFFFSNICELTL
ncbi:hypothetical protein Tco_1501806 [Tanacetum coccineum]